MRSLWSGVSGLQAHQVAMDVEGNNIANVNTVGFKYSRTNFADMLSQTSKIATAPADPLGGRNSLQVGLGATVSSVTHIFSQGSRQTTDKTTDVAIEGDGFFVVSPDNGITYKYTRAGDFTFDAFGNFVDNNGLVVQGWTKDENDKIDSTLPIKSIQIDPGMTIPAKGTENVTLRANLVSGSITNEMSSIYALDTDSATVADATVANGASVSGVMNQKPEDFGALFNASGKAYNLQNGQGLWVSFKNSSLDSTSSIGTVTHAGITTANMTLNGVTIAGSVSTDSTSTAAANASSLATLINSYTAQTGVTASVTGTRVTLTNTNSVDGDSKKNISFVVNGTDDTGLSSGSSVTAYKYQYTASSANPATNSQSIGVTKNFHTTEDLRSYLQWQAKATSSGALVAIDSDGKYTVTNQTGQTLLIAVTSIDGDGTVNPSPLLTQTFNAIEGSLPTGSASKTSQAITAATHASSIDIFDSLGSKHTVTYAFRKESQTTWSWSATVPSPADIGGTSPNQNVYQGGTVVFNSNGSLSSVNPQSLSVTWNNGSTANQQINLAFGTPGAFDGLTSFDQKSATSLISQDGYTGGDLDGIRIDQNGVLIGSFTNGRSLGLAQISMAKFANNEGLMADGGNLFIASANSGDPTVGAAASGGRGAVFSSALEMSNVDLSKSLTQLIVIQRGYQANSKTITTSDQMLQILLGLKQ